MIRMASEQKQKMKKLKLNAVKVLSARLTSLQADKEEKIQKLLNDRNEF